MSKKEKEEEEKIFKPENDLDKSFDEEVSVVNLINESVNNVLQDIDYSQDVVISNLVHKIRDLELQNENKTKRIDQYYKLFVTSKTQIELLNTVNKFVNEFKK